MIFVTFYDVLNAFYLLFLICIMTAGKNRNKLINFQLKLTNDAVFDNNCFVNDCTSGMDYRD